MVAGAQVAENGISGIVVDKWGNPLYGASIMVAGQPDTRVETDRDGNFIIPILGRETKLEVMTVDKGTKMVDAQVGEPLRVQMDYAAQTIDIGADHTFTRENSTASVATAYSEDFDKNGSFNISHSLYGQGLGLIALEGGGTYTNPTFYVRGIQSLDNNSPLVIVDGIERNMDLVSAEEVESVSILKDAAAVALYGYKGSNGVILITTKRGKYNSKEIKFSYDHLINFQSRRPEFVDAATYASAVNEARSLAGSSARYTQNEIDAYRNGTYPYAYPNVNWEDEVFKKTGVSNRYTMEFRGGGQAFRYYTMVDLYTDKGFIRDARANGDYSTQNKYTRANLRANLDMDLTKSTKMKFNMMATLSETLQPGDAVNLWTLIYETPANAFPVYFDEGKTIWGGNNTGFLGTANPVAQSRGAGYTKGHTRGLFADVTLSQDLSAWTKGLSVNMRLAYDNYSSITEDHSKTYSYAGYTSTWTSGDEPTITTTSGGEPTELGKDAETSDWVRRYNFMLSADYARQFGKHGVYGQLKYEYEWNDSYGLNTTVYTQSYSLFGHYAYNNRYIGEMVLLASESSKLAPGHKWAFSPTVSAAWVISNEDFMKGATWLDFLKLRASWGIINADNTPALDYWDQIYTTTGGTYKFDSSNDSDFGNAYISTLATFNSTHEKTFKYNLGIDATFFKTLNVTLEGYYQRRKDIWVESAGKYTSVLGMDAPYENAGIVDCWGVELGIDYTKQFGDFVLNVGGNFTFHRNKIVEELEEPRLYSNLVETGHRVNQVYGMRTIGFITQEDIDNGYTQGFSTVAAGDLKYADVNGDGEITSDDTEAIGYSTTAPEIYYSFHLGFEWKGLGLSAQFQGTGNYSAVWSLEGLYRPALNSTSLSQYYYDHRWTADGSVENPIFPRLVSESNSNNYRTSTTWLKDRSFLKLRNLEIYYKLPKRWVRKSTFIDNAKIYVRGVDLFSFDHMDGTIDPELYNTYTPGNWSILVGLNIGF